MSCNDKLSPVKLDYCSLVDKHVTSKKQVLRHFHIESFLLNLLIIIFRLIPVFINMK